VKQHTAQRLLAKVMAWGDDDDKAREEFDFWDLMAGLKYDDYREFLGGMRFLESLVAWLQQFDPADRAAAYNFVRNRLVFISPAERERLVALLYPRVVSPRVMRAAADDLQIRYWEVLATTKGRDALQRQRRATLFLGLSDGARLDSFRHINDGAISNEQVVVGVQLADDKWDDLLAKLRKDAKDDTARFERVILVDDFTASGTSFIRREEGTWKGKLKRFYSALGAKEDVMFHPDYELVIHHHIGTPKARDHLTNQVPDFFKERADDGAEPRKHFITFGHCYNDTLAVMDHDEPEFIAVTAKYFDKSLITEHTKAGGSDQLWLGYGECRLPVVLDHNTPNNTFAILWAQTAGKDGRPMRPLFRRRQRHS
jgi:hypothetical protein